MSTERPTSDRFAGTGAIAGSAARDQADATARLQPLTDRELEVLALLSTGMSAQAIGDQLGIKRATVKQHLRNLYRKLGATNRVQATRCYLLAQPGPPTTRARKRGRPGR